MIKSRHYFFVCVLLLWGCDRRIRLAYVGPLSGKNTIYGRLESQAAQLAVLDFNQQPGNKLRAELLLVDTEKIALEGLAKKLRRRQKVHAVIGPPTSKLGLGFLDQLSDYRLIAVSASASNPQLTFKNPWFFRLQPSDDLQAKVMGLYLYQVLKKRNIAILYTADAYGEALAKNLKSIFEHAGGAVAVLQPILTDKEDLRESIFSLTRVAELDALYLAANLYDARNSLALIMRTPLRNLTLMASDAFSKIEVRRATERFNENVFYAAASLDITNNEQFFDFIKDFRKTFRRSPDTFAINAYDASQLVLQNFLELRKKQLRVSQEELRQQIANNKKFAGVGGLISFNEDGEVQRSLAIYQIRSGKPKYLLSLGIRANQLWQDD